ncbi:MAG: hypothetical protein ABDH18_04670 [Aquificaceae bacterium]
MIPFGLLLLVLACSPVYSELSNCRSNIRPDSLVPEVCGNCILRVSEGRLNVEKVADCPRYQSYTCTYRGREVIIDNLKCNIGRLEQ